MLCSEIVNIFGRKYTNIFLLLQQLCADLMYLHFSCGADSVVEFDTVVRCGVAVVKVGATIYLTLEQLHYTTAVVLLWSRCDTNLMQTLVYLGATMVYTVRPPWCRLWCPVVKLYGLAWYSGWGAILQLCCGATVQHL